MVWLYGYTRGTQTLTFDFGSGICAVICRFLLREECIRMGDSSHHSYALLEQDKI